MKNLDIRKQTTILKEINHAYLAYEVDEKDLEKFIKNKYIKKHYQFTKDENFKLTAKKLKKEKLLLSVLIKWNLAQEL